MDEIDKYLASLQQDLKNIEKKVEFTRMLIKNRNEEKQNLSESVLETKLQSEKDINLTFKNSKNNLLSLYNDSIHICNSFYGSKRLADEECLLCLEMLDRG